MEGRNNIGTVHDIDFNCVFTHFSRYFRNSPFNILR